MASGQGNNDFYAFALLIVLPFYTIHADGEKIGVCYGMRSDSLPSPNEVVNLLQSNNIGKVRLYEANQATLQALKNSGLEVTVGVENSELEKTPGDQDAANAWVTDNIKPFYPSVNIKYIAVGNDVFATRRYSSYLLLAMENIQRALGNANLDKNIKISTPHSASVLSRLYPPSDGTFGENENMSAILKFLSDNDSPFMARVYPYYSYKRSAGSFSADYALFRSTGAVVTDGSLVYTNSFDAMVDTFISAMEKQGHPNIPIVVAETGWPSAGPDVATVKNARTYNNNLMKHVLSSVGTPKRPGRRIETYIFSLFNENQRIGSEEGRHFGLFETNKTAVYPLSSSPEGPRNLKVVYIYLTVV